MKTRSAKAKGRRLQNPVARILREVFGLSEADVHPALMGESGIDIKLSTEARSRIPYGFEAKNVERLNIWEAVKQAVENAGKEKLTPAVVIFRNRMPEPFVAIPWSAFLYLIQKDHLTQEPTEGWVTPRAFREYMKTEEEAECPTSPTSAEQT